MAFLDVGQLGNVVGNISAVQVFRSILGAGKRQVVGTGTQFETYGFGLAHRVDMRNTGARPACVTYGIQRNGCLGLTVKYPSARPVSSGS